jgi:hypothetical protein
MELKASVLSVPKRPYPAGHPGQKLVSIEKQPSYPSQSVMATPGDHGDGLEAIRPIRPGDVGS